MRNFTKEEIESLKPLIQSLLIEVITTLIKENVESVITDSLLQHHLTLSKTTDSIVTEYPLATDQ